MTITVGWVTLWNFVWTYAAVILVHEMGHYTVARLSGATSGTIHFGGEPSLFKIPVGCHLAISVGWRAWTVPFVRWYGIENDNTREFRCILGGPAASLLLVLVLLKPIIHYWGKLLESVAQGQFIAPHSILSCLSFWSLVLFVLPLVPVHYGSIGLDSDGLMLWHACRGKSQR